MIRVTIQMLPGGDESKARNLGTIEIANDGTGTISRGNYMARFMKFGRPKSIWKTGLVRDFPRQSRGPYDLLLRALVAVVGPRNKMFIAHLKEADDALSCPELFELPREVAK
ncbi:MAG TPA: hypothetical protein VF928_09390 [Usitatibacteraceae bacterium]